MSQTEPSRNTDEMMRLLTEQRDLYRRLRELSAQQRTLITGDRPDTLLNLLRERQTLVAALAQLNQRLAPYRRNWETLHRALPDEQRTQATALLGEINTLLQCILQTDQEDSALLSVRKQSVGQQLGTLADGRAAHAAYGRQTAPQTPTAADAQG